MNDFQYRWESCALADNQYWWQGILKKMHTQRYCLWTVWNMKHFPNWCLNKIFTSLHYFRRTCFKDSSAKALSGFLPTGFLFSQVGDCTRLYSEEETLQFPLSLHFLTNRHSTSPVQCPTVQTWSCKSEDQISNMKILHDLNGVFLLEFIPSILPAHIFWQTSIFLTNISIATVTNIVNNAQIVDLIYFLGMIYIVYFVLSSLWLSITIGRS